MTTEGSEASEHRSEPPAAGPQQMDLFRGGPADAGAGAPVWLDLPKDARDALVGLMMQLILEHARTSTRVVGTVEAGHDR